MKAAFTIVLIALGAFLFLACPQEQVLAQAEKYTKSGRLAAPDLQHGASFTFQIAPDLPQFTFKIISDGRESDNYGRPLATVRTIQVFKGAAKKPMQLLDGCPFEESEPPPAISDWFRAEDLNFDGYQDIFLLTHWGAIGNRFGCIWLYGVASARFKYNQEFSSLLSRYWLHPRDKTIFTFERGGAAGTVHEARRYKPSGEHLLLSWSEDQDWDGERRQFHCLVKERRDTEMVIVRDAWGGGDSDEPEPCSTDRLSSEFMTDKRPN